MRTLAIRTLRFSSWLCRPRSRRRTADRPEMDAVARLLGARARERA